MNNIYEKNLAALNKRYSKYAALIESVEGREDAPAPVIETAKNGEPTIKVLSGGKWKYIHSKFNPTEEASKWADEITLERKSRLTLFGFGLGYFASALAKRVKDDDGLIIIEPITENFKAAMETRDITDVISHERTIIVLGKIEDTTTTILKVGFDARRVNALLPLVTPRYDIAYPQDNDKYRKCVSDYVVATMVDKNTIIRYADDWTKTLLSNLKHYAVGVSLADFQNAFKGVPVIAVAAGPSLNKNVRALKKAKGHIPILCVYTAYRVLVKAGIEPDFVLSLDAVQTLMDTDDEVALCNSVPLICSLTTDKRLMDGRSGADIFANVTSCELTDLFSSVNGKKGESITVGASVSTLAVSAAEFMGADPIVIIGQDLAYTNNQTHADGTAYDKKNKELPEKTLDVEGNNGETLKTSVVMMAFKIWFDVFFQVFTENGAKAINATEGGAKIAHTEVATLEETIDKYIDKSVDVTRRINDIVANNHMFTKEHGEIIVSKIRKELERLPELTERLNEAVKLCKRAINLYQNGKSHRQKDLEAWMKRLDDIDTELATFHFMRAVADYKMYVFEIARESVDSRGALDNNIYILTREMRRYEGYIVTYKFIKPLVEDAADGFAKALGVYK